jgi:parallel beta-helix repeat protein
MACNDRPLPVDESDPVEADTENTAATITAVPTTVYLFSDGSGGYATLEAAIEGVPPNSTIILDTGQYELSAPLLITKSLTIQGAGVDLTTVSNSTGGRSVVEFDSDYLTIQDISFERKGEFANNIMLIFGGEVKLENCKLSGGSAAQDDSITGDGLWLKNDTVATVKNCQIENNMGAGIIVANNVVATIDQITCSNNQVGIAFGGESVGEIKNSNCSNNQTWGIYIINSAQVDIINNTIKNNGSVGIQFKLDRAGGEVRDNVLARNHLSVSGGGTDIQIWEEFSPTLIGNSCDGSGRSVFGGDTNGIVFIARGSLPTNPVLERNSCKIANCSTPTGSLLSLECE